MPVSIKRKPVDSPIEVIQINGGYQPEKYNVTVSLRGSGQFGISYGDVSQKYVRTNYSIFDLSPDELREFGQALIELAEQHL